MNVKSISLNKHTIVYSCLFFAFLIQFINLPAYDDDLNRFGWNFMKLAYQGRVVTELYYSSLYLFQQSLPVNIYTANLIIIGVVMFFTAKYFYGSLQIHNLPILTVALVMIHPFIIENLSYHIDSIGMGMALCIAVFASVFVCKNKVIYYLLPVTLLTLASAMYQSSISVYCSTVVLVSTVLSLSDKTSTRDVIIYITKKIVIFLFSILGAFILYKIFVTSPYIQDKSKLIPFTGEFIHKLSLNVSRVIDVIYSSLNDLQILIIASMVMIYYVSSIIYIISKKPGALKTLMSLFGPLISAALIFLPTVLFENTVMMPRIFMSFGACIAILSLTNVNAMACKTSAILSCILLSTVVMTASAHVSSVKYIYGYMNRVLTSIDYNARIDNQKSSLIKIKFLNRVRYPGEALTNSNAFPIVGKINKINFAWEWSMGVYMNYFNYNFKIVSNAKTDGKTFVTEERVYRMYKKDDVYLIEFK